MSNHIDFLTFKKLLNNKNILLFDGQYRIAHFRFNNLLKNINQTGGTDKLINNCLFERLINSLLENNNQTATYIVSLIN